MRSDTPGICPDCGGTHYRTEACVSPPPEPTPEPWHGDPINKPPMEYTPLPDPTPKLTAECACGRSTPCCPAQAKQDARVRAKAFEEAADRANRIGENDPSEAIRIAFLRFSAELRALAKEQTDGR